MVDAHSILATTYRRYEIETKPIVDTQFKVTEKFASVLSKAFSIAILGFEPLSRLLNTHS